MTAFAISAAGLGKTYGVGPAAVHALIQANLQVPQGEFLALMGPSGSGKSTLLALLGGLDAPDQGEVLIEGRPLKQMREAQLAKVRRERIGFVFQAFNLIPVLTAAENVALPLLLGGRQGAPVQRQVDEALAQVGLTDRAHHRPAELSGGQQQRVAIARALVTEPAIILADEPTGNLDSRSSQEVMRTLRRAVERLGQTVVLITHDPGIAAWADRVVFMRDGRLVGEWRPEPARTDRTRAITERYEALTGGVA